MIEPRGIRNNNPGNIRKGTNAWKGLVEPGTDPAFCQFEAPQWGIRAMAVTLRTYQNKYKIRTIRQAITRWAPGSENNTAAYIASVCEYTKYGADAILNFNDEGIMARLVKAIIKHENGQQPYPDKMVFLSIKEM